MLYYHCCSLLPPTNQWKEVKQLSNVAAQFYGFTFKDNQENFREMGTRFYKLNPMTSLQFKDANQYWIVIRNNHKDNMFLFEKKESRQNKFLTGVTKLYGVDFCHNLQLKKKKAWYKFFSILMAWLFVVNFLVILNCKYA